jgi:hypothetical protein
MKKKSLIVTLLIFTSTVMLSKTATVIAQARTSKLLPEIKQNGEVKQMFVDGKPFIMLAGELHNSSASGIDYMKPIWDKLAEMHLNTIVSTVSWELLEPEEGKFDFKLVNAQIQEAQKRDMRLVIIWFASWKNGSSTYPPIWVKANPERFPLQQTRVSATGRGSGGRTGTLSPLGEASMLADAKAFRALMRHIKQTDPKHTVIMMQVENEMGLMGDSRDRSPLAEAAWAKPVPAELMNYFSMNKATLLPEMQEVWGRNGYKTSGTWAEVFGTDEWADEVLQAWYYSRYLEKVISEGKAELNIPMYVNAWLGPQPGETLPGSWPSGGPVARVMDVWRAGAPSVDLLAPDIYVQDFKGTCALYARSGNPLFIPEARDQVGNLFWALGQHSAMGWTPFGVEDLDVNGQVSKAYGLLSGMLPRLAEWQAAGKVAGVLLLDGETQQVVTMGGYKVTLTQSSGGRGGRGAGAGTGGGRGGRGVAAPTDSNAPAGRGNAATGGVATGGGDGTAPAVADATGARSGRGGQTAAAGTATTVPALGPGGVSTGSRAMPGDTRPFGLVINTAPDEFLFVGSNLRPSFSVDSSESVNIVIGSVDEGRYEKGIWVPGRRFNGDERGRNSLGSDTIGMLKIRVYQSQ